jgi:anaerobic magnesium-protoporphyrin IX monomethyl ester cyclase
MSPIEPRRSDPGSGSRGTVALVSIYDPENNATRQLAPALRDRGYRTLEVYFKDWRNNAFDPPRKDELVSLRELLHHERVDLVGFSLRASAYQAVATELASLVRSQGIPVLVGGWHATVRPEACLEFADAVCLGEGDNSLPELVDRFFSGDGWQATPGFFVRLADGRVLRNPPAERVSELDALPWRDYTHPDKWMLQRGRVTRRDPMARDPLFQVMSSQGCVQNCSFCHNSFDSPYQPRSGGGLRFRSVDSVLDELAAARRRNPHIRRIRFDDEIFGSDPRWLERFAEVYPQACGLPFDLMAEPRVVTPRYADHLAAAGAEVVHLGIQHSEDVNRRTFKRRASPEHTRRAIRLLTERGIMLRYLMMVDIPGVTAAQNEALVRFLMDAPRPYDVYLFSLTWFPGSAIVEQMLASGVLDPSDVEGVATKTFRQYRVDLDWPRSAEDQFWLSLIVLASSGATPRPVLERLMRSERLRRDPARLKTVAAATNAAKTFGRAVGMTRSGELTFNHIRRWWKRTTFITT